MHPTRCWQGSGGDELTGLFHPLCFRSAAWMGRCTAPRLPFAAGRRGTRLRPRSTHQHISRDLPGRGSGRGCRSGSPPAAQCATTALSILSASPGGRVSPCATAEGEAAKDGENTAVTGESLHTHRQAGETWGLENALSLRKGLSALRGWDAHVPLAQLGVPLCPPAPACGEQPPGAGGGWEQKNPRSDTLLLLGHFLRNNWELWSRYVSADLPLFSLGALGGAKKKPPRCNQQCARQSPRPLTKPLSWG